MLLVIRLCMHANGISCKDRANEGIKNEIMKKEDLFKQLPIIDVANDLFGEKEFLNSENETEVSDETAEHTSFQCTRRFYRA
jgi:hypothetical protein